MVNRLEKYLTQAINWDRFHSDTFVFSTSHDGQKIYLRVNDFPAEHLYSLVVGEAEISFDDWPNTWERQVGTAATVGLSITKTKLKKGSATRVKAPANRRGALRARAEKLRSASKLLSALDSTSASTRSGQPKVKNRRFRSE